MSLRICGVFFAVLFCQSAWTQTAPAGAREMRGLPPRATVADYQAHAQAGALAIGAEFTAHSVPTAESIFSTADFVVVEVGLFGPAGARVAISGDNFSLRINGKKGGTAAEPYEMAFKSLQDPTWVSPIPVDPKSKSGINTGSQGQGGEEPPPKPHMTIEEQRAMEKQVRNAALPVGELPSPQAGLLFFRYGGDASKIRQVELIYDGPAGKATIPLHP